jgi:hypothetical protein
MNRTIRPFTEELPDLLQERELSVRGLPRIVDVGQDHPSRVPRGDRAKKPTWELTRRVAVAPELPEDYFPEARLEFIVERLGEHPALLDRVYDQVRKG